MKFLADESCNFAVVRTLRDAGYEVLAVADVSPGASDDAVIALGLKPLDALHLAAAVEAQADYFCTCDDRLLRRAKTADTLRTKVVSPLELITEVTR